MMVRVHRGSHEVGGTWVEIEHLGDRLLLDAGGSGTGTRAERSTESTDLGIDAGSDSRLRGVLVAYPHLDHQGVVDRLSSRARVYLGREAAAIASASRGLTASGPLTTPITPAGYLEDRQPLHLGQFTITPQLVDHWGVDAFALVIDADAERLVWTGLLRGHGRDVTLFDRLVANPPSGVDTLLLEGAPVSTTRAVPTAGSPDETPCRGAATESELELDMAATFLAADGLAVVVSAAQHMDRLVTAYRACLRSGRTLLVDLYAATVARAIGRATLPQPGFPQLGVHVPDRQRLAVVTSGEPHLLESVAAYCVEPGTIAAHPDEFVVLTGEPTVDELLRLGALDRDGVVVWSRGSGSLRDAAGEAMRDRLASAAVRLVQHHTSGHPSDGDLARLVTAVGARQVVAMHAGAPGGADRIWRTSRPTVAAPDGWWEVLPVRTPSGSRRVDQSQLTA